MILNYHSGEADDHLARWGVLVHPWLRLAHEIVVPSEYLRGVFARHGYRARVIPNIVDTSQFRYRERSPLRPRLVSTRNFEPYYALDNTIETFALVREQCPKQRLTLAGYGAEERATPSLWRARWPQGPSTSSEGSSLRTCRLCSMRPTCSSTLLSWTISLYRCSRRSRLAFPWSPHPPVTSPTWCAMSETGLLVPARDPAAMAKAVMSLLEDPVRAAAIARRARGEVERYAWPHVGPQWAGIYAGTPA